VSGMDFLINGEKTPDFENKNCMLFNCDCRELLKNIKDKSIDLFCSDIPYKLARKGNGIKKDGKKYSGGIFNYFDNTKENIDNIKKRKDFSK